MRTYLLQILACYIAGMIAGNLIFFPFYGMVVFFTAIVGILAGLPELIITLLVFISLKPWIMRYLLFCCAVAPFLIVIAWLSFEWMDFSQRGHDIYWYLSLRGTWDRATLAFACASFASALFWYWNRDVDPVDAA
jgi:uncharacterized membrane protein YkvI